MAVDHPTTVAPGVLRTEYHWGYILNGSEAALTSAALVQESWLEDGTARDKRGRVVRSKRLTVNGRHICTTMTDPKRQLFKVRVRFTAAETAARENTKAAAEAVANVRRNIEAMPKRAEEYRARLVDMFERFGAAIIDFASTSSHGGYRLHAETIAELQRLTGHIANAIEIGEIVFDRKARMAAEIKIRSQAANAGPWCDSHYLGFRHNLLPRSGWKGSEKLRAEVEALYKAEP